jgi:eukaryotic-like serine/threonine-protein kinase
VTLTWLWGRARLRPVPGGETRIGMVLNGTYRIERLLGEGGMGTVYEAVHQRVPRRFAVKMLNPEIIGNREVFDRFRREAEIASSLGSQHIVQVFDFNHAEDGSPYMVLELLDGHDLAKRIGTRGRLTVQQTGDMLEQASQALSAAHAAGIVHRDLKPANIFMTRFETRDDFVKILDFGISKVLHSQTGATRTGTVFGTPNYMSPEQAEGRQGEIDHRTDLFAVGAILYECLTGKMAFEAPTLIGTIYQVCHGSPQPVRSFAPEVPDAIERVLARAMAKQREQRHADIAALRDEFLAASRQAGGPPSFATIPAAPPTAVVAPTTLSATPSEIAARTAPPAAPARGGKPLVAAGAALGAIALAAGAWLLLGRGPAAPTPSTAAPQVAAAPAPPAQAPVAAPPPAANTPTVEIKLQITPAAAELQIDGVVTTANPLRLVRGEPHKVTVSAPGYVTHEQDLRPAIDGELVVNLDRASKPAAASVRRAPPRSKKRKVNLEEW